MRKYEYSKDLVNIVKQFLVDDDWHFSFDENTGVFDFGLKVESKIQRSATLYMFMRMRSLSMVCVQLAQITLMPT